MQYADQVQFSKHTYYWSIKISESQLCYVQLVSDWFCKY